MKVCFLGLGSMGSGVCRNLLNKGYALQVWNRSPEKAAKVAGWGAEAFATPQEATRGAGVVMSCRLWGLCRSLAGWEACST